MSFGPVVALAEFPDCKLFGKTVLVENSQFLALVETSIEVSVNSFDLLFCFCFFRSLFGPLLLKVPTG